MWQTPYRGYLKKKSNNQQLEETFQNDDDLQSTGPTIHHTQKQSHKKGHTKGSKGIKIIFFFILICI